MTRPRLRGRLTAAVDGNARTGANCAGEGIRYEDHKGAEQLRSEIALYEWALDLMARFLEVLANLGYEDRRTRVLERNADAEEALCKALLRSVGVQWADPRGPGGAGLAPAGSDACPCADTAAID